MKVLFWLFFSVTLLCLSVIALGQTYDLNRWSNPKKKRNPQLIYDLVERIGIIAMLLAAALSGLMSSLDDS